VLYALRARHIRSDAAFALFSRETLLLANNVLLMVACAAVLLGTFYPLAMDALNLGKISVGPPYFNTIFAPLTLGLALLVGLGPAVAWRRGDPAAVARRLRTAALAAVALGGLAVWLLSDNSRLVVLVTVWLALWILFTALTGILERVRHRSGPLPARLAQIPRGFWGMHLAHVGLAVSMVGVAVVTSHESETFHRMLPGETVEAAGYRWTFNGVRPARGPNFEAVEGQIVVSREGRIVAVLYPQKRHYPVRDEVMTQAGIRAGLNRDLFTALGDPLDGDAWVVRMHYKPMVRWIWLGAILMILGAGLAASDRRYQATLRHTAAEAAARAGNRGTVLP
jgi:cytochrome c-type biogenesis protein CcmF